ncbi:sacsin N-terminal ATP-binding-like domain-containing protein [Kineococcus sp. GCM10028916]|uniref:sacsin N-terminal ATP-binding-like domain-containing protein n=1 Tax=Kineococcus sp. GCM10028916 TaxID=3273394 RepID=UPI00362A8B7D
MREDANAEEDASLGAYRDRLVVELAQNAADAASAAGVEGRLLLRLLDDPAGGPGRLLAANTGTPLDAAGVQGLATLRASAKRDPATAVVGRFGVGFAAVLAVCDDPAVRSVPGAVRFSRSASADLLRSRGSAALVAEVDGRDGHVPALRLPFPAPDAAAVPAGYDTVVELPLRDADARAAVEALLTGSPGGVDDVLLLALPALAEIVVEVPGAAPRRLADVHERWRVLRRSGRHDPADLADRGVEDRRRLGWQLTWALPTAAEARTPGVVCAPTPTDEDLPWPAVLVATFPLGPDRRRIAPGRAADVLLDAAADAFCALLSELAGDGGDALALLPYGAAAGRVDAELRLRVLDRARAAPVLSAVERVDGAPMLLRPSSAVALTGAGADDPALLGALAPALAGLVAAPRAVDRLLTELGVTRLGLADVLDLLPGLDAEGSRELFAALAPLAADPSAREAMSGLPVPLLDGRRVHGARGTVLLDDPDLLGTQAAQVFAAHGLRVVDPAASQGPARELLSRLGAREGGAWAVLTDPAVRAAVVASPDAEDPDEVAAAVLDLVAAVIGSQPGSAAEEETVLRTARELPWLADLALPDVEDDLAPAGALLLPGTLAERAFDPDDVTPVAPETLQEWGSDVLRAVGVLSGPALTHVAELDLNDLDGADDAGLAGFADYVEDVWADLVEEGEALVADVVVVRDLDLVLDAWPEVLADLAGSPAGLQALTGPWTLGAHRRQGLVAWWLRRHGPLPDVSRAPDGAAPPWLPLAPEWVAPLPPLARRALGVLPDLASAGADDLPGLLRASAGSPPAAVDLMLLWALLGRSAQAAVFAAPQRFAALDAAGAVVVAEADDVVVVDSPAWAQRTDLGPRLLVPAAAATAVADLLELDLSSERGAGRLEHPAGETHPVPATVGVLAAGVPATWSQVTSLRCDGQPVRFWVTAEDEVIAVDPAAAACGLAQVAGAWPLRGALTELLTTDSPAAVLGAELPGLP